MMFSVDKEVETAFVNINPVLGDVSVPMTEKGKDKNGNEVEQNYLQINEQKVQEI